MAHLKQETKQNNKNSPNHKPCFALRPSSLTLSSWQEEVRTGWDRVGLSQFSKVGQTDGDRKSRDRRAFLAAEEAREGSLSLWVQAD